MSLLPPEVERALWGRIANKWSGTITLHLHRGDLLSFEVAEKHRIAGRVTHESPGNDGDSDDERVTHASPVHKGRTRDGTISDQ